MSASKKLPWGELICKTISNLTSLFQTFSALPSSVYQRYLIMAANIINSIEKGDQNFIIGKFEIIKDYHKLPTERHARSKREFFKDFFRSDIAI